MWGGGNKKVVFHNWSALVPFVSPSPVAPQPQAGTVTVSGNRLVPSGYGSGSGWHGPAAYLNVGTINDFVLETTFTLNNPSSFPIDGVWMYLFDYAAGIPRAYFYSQDAWDANNNRNTGFLIDNNGTLDSVYEYLDAVNRIDSQIKIEKVGAAIKCYWGGTLVYSGNKNMGPFDTIIFQFVQYQSYTAGTLNFGPFTLEH